MQVASDPAVSVKQPDGFQRAMLWSARLLVAIVWVSALIFGLYIFVAYFLSSLTGQIAQWNRVLPNLYSEDTPLATFGIGVHFAAGSLILMLGCIQLVERIRRGWPVLHRWLGRLYVVSALAAGLGGLVFIAVKGTVGGWVMDVGFTGYGVLTVVAAVAAIHFARKRDFERHRAWAIRLFALAIGSWLYRMEYGLWFAFADGLGHTRSFDGPFDHFMSFFFYLPNLLVAEIIIGRHKIAESNFVKGFAVVGMLFASTGLLAATYFATRRFWGPEILAWFTSGTI